MSDQKWTVLGDVVKTIIAAVKPGPDPRIAELTAENTRLTAVYEAGQKSVVDQLAAARLEIVELKRRLKEIEE